MDTEIVKIINIKTDQAINTVKELKNYINELRDDLVKTDKSSEEYGKTLEEIAKAQTKLTEVTKDSKNAMNYAEGSYRALNQELVNLRNEYKNLSAEERENAEVGGAMLQRIAELDSELKSIDATMGNFQRNVGNYKSALDGVNIAFVNQRQELKALKTQLEQLTPGTEAYIKAFNRAAEITHNLAEQQEMLKYSSKDLGDQLSNIRGIASNMVAGISAVNAAMGLFGEKNEDVQKAMLKVQQCMAIVQGMQGMDGLLKRTKGLSTAMKAWYTSTLQVTAAENGQTVATNILTVAQQKLNAAMKANPIGLVVTALMALITVFTLFGGKIKEAIKGSEKLNQALGKLKGGLAAAGAAIKNYFLVPIKEVLNVLGTVGKVMIDVFTGQWGKIGDDIKSGVNNAKTIVVDAVEDIETAYDNGVKKHAEQRTRELNAELAKQKQQYIEEKEAENDANWKFSEEGQKAYQELFDAEIGGLEENSEEWRKATLKKKEYLRDLKKFNDKQEEDATKKAKEEAEKRKREAEKIKQQQEQIEKKYQSQIAKSYGSSTSDLIGQYKERAKTIIEYYRTFKTGIKEIDEFVKGFINGYEKDINKVFDKTRTRILETKGILKGLSDAEIKTITEGKYDSASFKASVEKLGEEGGMSFVEGYIYAMASQTQRFNKELVALVNDSVENSGTEIKKKLDDGIVLLFEKSIKPKIDKELAALARDVDTKQLELSLLQDNLELVDDTVKTIENFENSVEKENKILEKNTEIFKLQQEELLKEKEYYQAIVDFTNENELLPSDEFENAKEQLEKINKELQKLQINYAKVQSKAKAESTNGQFSQNEKELNEALSKIRGKYAQKDTSNWYNYLNSQTNNWSNIENTKKRFEEEHAVRVEYYEKQKSLLEQSLADERLIGDEKIAVQEKLDAVKAEMATESFEYQQSLLELQLEKLQEFLTRFKAAVGAMGDLFGALADYYQQDTEYKKKKGQIDEQTYRKEFERNKNLQIAAATMNMLAGIVGGFEQGIAQFGLPYGAIIGAAAATTAAINGATQIAKIKQTEMNGASTSAAITAPSTNYDYTPVYTQNQTNQSDIDNLRNAVVDGMNSVNLSVSVTEINEVQKRVKVKEQESNF